MNASVYPFILGEHRQIVAMKTKETALRRKKGQKRRFAFDSVLRFF